MDLFSIRYKLSALLLVAILIPIATSILITYHFTKNSVKEDLIHQNSKLLFQGRVNIQNYLADIDQVTHSTLFYGSSLFETVKKGSDNFLQQIEVNGSLETLGNSTASFYQVALRIDKDEMTHLFWKDYVRNQKNVDITTRTDATVYIDPTHRSDSYGIKESLLAHSYQSVPVFSFYRVLEDIPLKDRLGVLVVDVKLDYLAFIAEMLYTAESDEQILILDEEHNVIYSTGDNWIGSRLEDAWLSRLADRETEASHFEVNDSSFSGLILYESTDLPFADWTLIKKIPKDLFSESAEQLLMLNTLVLVLFLMVAAFASLIVVYNFIDPIKRLIHEIELVERRDFRASFQNVKRKDEFGVLFNKFHNMVEHLNHLILREYRMEIANKTNQLKALQAQINPHFLNNALQSIGTLALKEENLKVYSLASAIGRMMHYNMDLEETIVPLSREIEYIRSYLEVQQERFEELEVRFELDSAAMDIPLPKMTLQPIVENYFKHGIIEGEARIVIAARLAEPGLLMLTVEDNGAGIPADKLTRLQRELNASEYAFNAKEHIGLNNVMSRLKLYYHDEVAMIFSGVHPRGLNVTIAIPLNRGGEDEHESIDRR
ncbi:sensor histidine kinase [Cohnella hongkongensis]|uniref:Sensor histidine kinase n=1 Tax=Cohnella hongkongensis TaxID=178337 RepID=A0ABV9FA13_9BACL